MQQYAFASLFLPTILEKRGAACPREPLLLQNEENEVQSHRRVYFLEKLVPLMRRSIVDIDINMNTKWINCLRFQWRFPSYRHSYESIKYQCFVTFFLIECALRGNNFYYYNQSDSNGDAASRFERASNHRRAAESNAQNNDGNGMPLLFNYVAAWRERRRPQRQTCSMPRCSEHVIDLWFHFVRESIAFWSIFSQSTEIRQWILLHAPFRIMRNIMLPSNCVLNIT